MVKRLILLLLTCVAAVDMAAAPRRQVCSPDGRIEVGVDVDKAGRLYYHVNRDGKPVLLKSRLGIKVRNAADMTEGFSIVRCTFGNRNETWHCLLYTSPSPRD